TEEFIALDDVSLTQRLQDYGHTLHRKRMIGKSAVALKLLSGDASIYDYTCSWLPRPTVAPTTIRRLILPDQLFYDTFSNEGRSLYKKSSVRVQSDTFGHIGKPLLLEECAGPLTPLFVPEQSSILP